MQAMKKIPSEDIRTGTHIVIKCYECPLEKIEDTNFIHKFLGDLSEKLGIASIMPPYVFKCEEQDIGSRGISGMVLLNNAHVTVHTFPDSCGCFVDIFSAAGLGFESGLLVSFVLDYFTPASHVLEASDQGQAIPSSIRGSAETLSKSRQDISV